MRFILIPLLAACVTSAWALEDYDRQQILERIQPVGQIRIKGGAPAAVGTSSEQPVLRKLSGQDVYEGHCVVCHQDGVAGAPKFRDQTDWAPRQAKSNLGELLAIAIKGLNAMPPKGTCGECSDEDIKNAIQYMLPRK